RHGNGVTGRYGVVRPVSPSLFPPPTFLSLPTSRTMMLSYFCSPGGRMPKLIKALLAVYLLLVPSQSLVYGQRAQSSKLKIGVASVAITPFGPNPDWDGQTTESGVWGEKFTDTNHNGRWDNGEPYEDDPENDKIDASSKGKYDGIFLAGFGNNRPATGKHDDLFARTIVIEYATTKIAIVAIDVIGYYSKA